GRVLIAYLVGDALLRIALGPLRGDLSTQPLLLGLTGQTLTTLGLVIAAIATEAWSRRDERVSRSP
ncbi:MAG: hypothetical protein ABI321_10375, partial [Polyangia bacterium]